MMYFLKNFERVIVYAIIVMLMVVIALTTIELAWFLYRDISTPPVGLLDIDEMLNLFGFFLLILIGVELLETVKAYLVDNVVHVEIVLEVALIAIARKVIIIDLEKYSAPTIIGIAALITGIGATVYLIKYQQRMDKAGVEAQLESE